MRIPLLASLLLASTLSTAHAAEPATPAHWGYQGKDAPSHWGELSPQFKMCLFGKHQSPINIQRAKHTRHEPLLLNIQPTAQQLVNNGHTVEVLTGPGTELTLDGKRYTLQQFHFHTPAENTLDGHRAPMEGHFVFSDGSDALVMAVMFTLGKDDRALDQFVAQLAQAPHEPQPMTPAVDIQAMMPKTLHYYRFTGSLTTPPCTENVTWLVLDHPVQLAPAQLKAFQQAIGQHNNRPTQPLNDRTITD